MIARQTDSELVPRQHLIPRQPDEPSPVEHGKPRSSPVIVRTLAYALIVLAVSYFVAFIRAPAVQFLAVHLGFAAGLPWACSTASAITRDRPALLILVASVVLLIAPNGVHELSCALVPVGAGLVVGHLLGMGIREERGQQPLQ